MATMATKFNFPYIISLIRTKSTTYQEKSKYDFTQWSHQPSKALQLPTSVPIFCFQVLQIRDGVEEIMKPKEMPSEFHYCVGGNWIQMKNSKQIETIKEEEFKASSSPYSSSLLSALPLLPEIQTKIPEKEEKQKHLHQQQSSSTTTHATEEDFPNYMNFNNLPKDATEKQIGEWFFSAIPYINQFPSSMKCFYKLKSAIAACVSLSLMVATTTTPIQFLETIEDRYHFVEAKSHMIRTYKQNIAHNMAQAYEEINNCATSNTTDKEKFEAAKIGLLPHYNIMIKMLNINSWKELTQHINVIDKLVQANKATSLNNINEQGESEESVAAFHTSRPTQPFQSTQLQTLPQQQQQQSQQAYFNAAPPQFANNSRTPIICSYCRKRGHTVEKCWAAYPHLSPYFRGTTEVINLVNYPNNKLPMLTLLFHHNIKEEAVIALLDTGSKFSLINYETCEKLKINIQKLSLPCILKTADGKICSILGQIETSFSVGTELVIKCKMIVIKNLIHPIILGTDCIRLNKIQINLHENTIKIHEKTFALNCTRMVKNDGKATVSPIAEEESWLPSLKDQKQQANFDSKRKLYNDEQYSQQFDEFLKGKSTSHLNQDEKELAKKFLMENKLAFSWETAGIGRLDEKIFKYNIETINNVPVASKNQRMSLVQEQTATKMVEELLARGIISPCESPYSSPLLCLPKPNSPGEYRMVIDLRELNKITIPWMRGQKSIAEQFDKLFGFDLFSMMDLHSAFFQIPLSYEASLKTAFSCKLGQFCFNVLPQGAVNSSRVLQYIIDTILRPVEGNTANIADDVLAFSRAAAKNGTLVSFKQHLEELGKVLQRFIARNLTFSLAKFKLALPEVKFLGSIINKDGKTPDPERLKRIKQFPCPTNADQCKQWAGTVEYLASHIPGCATTLGPITRNKEIFNPDDKELVTAFNVSKQLVLDSCTLAFPNFNKQFIMRTDACATGISAILFQEDDNGVQKIIHAYSRALTPAEKHKHINELELMAVVAGVQKHGHLLRDKKFIVLTDNTSITRALEKKDLNSKLLRWAIYLSEYDFTFEYRKANTNAVADAFSRAAEKLDEIDVEAAKSLREKEKYWRREENAQMSDEDTLANVNYEDEENEQEKEITTPPLIASAPQSSTKANEYDTEEEADWSEGPNLQTLQREEEKFKHIIKYIEDGVLPQNKELARTTIFASEAYMIKDKILYYIGLANEKNKQNIDQEWGRTCIPEIYRQTIIKNMHGNLRDGGTHPGRKGTRQRIAQKYYWPNMMADIDDHVAQCDCRSWIHENKKGTLHKINTTSFNECIEMDYFGPIKKSQNNKAYALIIIDLHTRYALIIPSEKADAETSKEGLRVWIRHHGPPQNVITDRGTHFFTPLFTKSINLQWGVKFSNSAAYQHQSMGGVESMVKITKAAINKLSIKEEEWDQHIPEIEWGLNTTITSSTGTTPYYAKNHTNPKSGFEKIINDKQLGTDNDGKGDIEKENEIIIEKKKKEAKAQEEQYNKNRQQIQTFKKGEVVWAKRMLIKGKESLREKVTIVEKSETNQYNYMVKDARGKTKEIHEMHLTATPKPLTIIRPALTITRRNDQQHHQDNIHLQQTRIPERIITQRNNEDNSISYLIKWKNTQIQTWERADTFKDKQILNSWIKKHHTQFGDYGKKYQKRIRQ